jgi:pantetheine-phosphate adenylyltransferase
MTRSVAFYAGSFDPVTLGHVDVIVRALALFDELVVAIGHNPAKQGRFPVQERVALLRAAAPVSRVEVFQGLAIDAAQKAGATVMVRGIRGPADLDLEMRNAVANREMSGMETIFLPTDPRFAHVSSSLVREIYAAGGDVRRYVPEGVWEALRSSGGASSPR